MTSLKVAEWYPSDLQLVDQYIRLLIIKIYYLIFFFFFFFFAIKFMCRVISVFYVK